jgi:hypothetical protein
VITKQKTSDRESRLKDISTFRLPALIHSHNLIEYELTPGNELKNKMAIIRVRIALIPTDPAPIIPAILRLNKCPNRARIKKLRNGIAGISAIIVDIHLFTIILRYN